MLLSNYASDSDSDASDTEVAAPAPVPAPAPAPAARKPVKRKGPIKIGLDLPALDKSKSKDSENDDDDEPEEDRGLKKARTGGAGSSSLLGMLPPPKRKLPASASGSKPLMINRAMAAKPKLPPAVSATKDEDSDDEGPSLLPPSLARKAAKAPAADLDLFGLSEASAPKPRITSTATSKPPTISAAPAVADFVPPPPTAADPYPGYYQLPSGSWAAYDPAYYASFFDDGSKEIAAQEEQKAQREGRAWAELDDGRAQVVDFDVGAGLAEGKKQRERAAAIGKNKPKFATDDFEYSEIGQTKGLAAERHQLTSLLSSAYSQREELEARIAQNKKNMRAAGTKYGF